MFSYNPSLNQGIVPLVDSPIIVLDVSLGANGSVILGDDRELGLPVNAVPGNSGVIEIWQDATGGRALTLAAGWLLSAGDIADIAVLGVSEGMQLTWFALSTGNFNCTLLPLQ
jgi:nitrogen fixation protein